MGEVVEDSVPTAPPEVSLETLSAAPASAALVQNSPSLSRKPLLSIEHPSAANHNKTPKTSRTPNFITPLGSPIRRAIKLTKLDPQDAWLPITESRNGNAYYAAFHTLCSGIGIQALVLPVAFTILGWYIYIYILYLLLFHLITVSTIILFSMY